MTTIPVQVLKRFTLQTSRKGFNGLLPVLILHARDLHVNNARFLELSEKRNHRLRSLKMYNQFAENSRKMSVFAGKDHDYIFRQVRKTCLHFLH